MSRDIVNAIRRGEMRPPGEDGRVDETEKLRAEIVALRGELAMARAQRAVLGSFREQLSWLAGRLTGWTL